MIVYQFDEERLCREELGSYTAFSICAYEVSGGTRRLLLRIPDVFRSREKAAAFAARCNALQLSLIHLPDVMYDALAG
ncbi:hypothetical protein [uncultured Oscillibacter sp.]|uniref:hypothetical protein n=1 Tax=uncultured Oscillibacter sp. TaxID=876091 RepID=UPI0025CC55F2|nr:hypothetical protein [uncultured Oscillibacter sp.]